jgi:hypothetical protein
VTHPRPKGLASYTPRAGSKNAALLAAASAVVERYEAEGRLPLGPREVGYLLTGDEFGYTHDDIDLVEDVIVRGRRAGLIPWDAISDSRTGVARPWTVAGSDALADVLLDQLPDAQLDRQQDQRYRVEVWAEAAGWLDRLEPICNERGVTVYSGSGSVPVTAVRQAAIRAINAHPQRTVILSIGDLDLNGIRNIARPFAEDVLQMTADLLRVEPRTAGAVVTVRRLLLTAEQVEEHIGARARAPVSAAAHKAGWPWPFQVQAEALAPEIRDGIVLEAIDALHDTDKRDLVAEAEDNLHEEARRAIAAKLNGNGK